MNAINASTDWHEVDQTLRSIAARRAALDAEEARWLREAERLEIWRPLGMVSAIDYCERVLGYSPHAAIPLCQGSCRLWVSEREWGRGRNARELLTKCTSPNGASHDWSQSDIAS